MMPTTVITDAITKKNLVTEILQEDTHFDRVTNLAEITTSNVTSNSSSQTVHNLLNLAISRQHEFTYLGNSYNMNTLRAYQRLSENMHMSNHRFLTYRRGISQISQHLRNTIQRAELNLRNYNETLATQIQNNHEMLQLMNNQHQEDLTEAIKTQNWIMVGGFAVLLALIVAVGYKSNEQTTQSIDILNAIQNYINRPIQSVVMLPSDPIAHSTELYYTLAGASGAGLIATGFLIFKFFKKL